MNLSKRKISLVNTISYVVQNEGSSLLLSSMLDSDFRNYFLRSPTEKIVISAADNWNEKLKIVDSRVSANNFILACINYESGWLFEEKFKNYLSEADKPLMTFLIYPKENVLSFTIDEIDFSGFRDNISAGSDVREFELNVTKNEFCENIGRIKKYIEEGDTYQVNYTVKGRFNISGRIESLAAKMIFNQSGAFSAIVNIGGEMIISVSPELFFRISNDKITVQPMKGTIERGINLKEDRRNYEKLKKSRKDSAENVMIVDLLRNDIGKLCKYESVTPNSLFDIQKLETVFQMTSTIGGELETKSFCEILRKLFPCGSITGAPKIRTMQIIHELEKEPRGIYTGSIGFINDNESVFNVAIRTVEINRAGKNGIVGIGSGIVWDSNPEEEYSETLSKAKFLTNPREYFELIETMLLENGKIFLLEEHLERMKASAEYFLFNFPEDEIKSEIAEKTDSRIGKFKLRLLLKKWGEFSVELSKLASIEEPIQVLLSDKRTDSKNPFQYFKTTNRSLYYTEFRNANNSGFDEVIFLNERDELSEGAVSNILVEINGEQFTPSINAGILNGCYRRYLINSGEVRERTISAEEFLNADSLYLINSVRRQRAVSLIKDAAGKVIWRKDL